MIKDEDKFYMYFTQVIAPFMNDIPSKDLVIDWVRNRNVAIYEDQVDLQIFIIDNTKPDFVWTSGIGLIDGVLEILHQAKINGNIKY